jgi:hypothetical protein
MRSTATLIPEIASFTSSGHNYPELLLVQFIPFAILGKHHCPEPYHIYQSPSFETNRKTN